MARTQSAPQDRTPRLGPRPLPLHLMAAALTWASSRAALPLLRNGSLPWSSDLREAGAALQSQLAHVDPDAFGHAVDRHLRRRMHTLADGILAYRRHGYRRDLAEAPVVWRDGTTCLRDFGTPGGTPVLVVPSLINRAYILDLTEECSFLRWLSAQGFRPLLVDWDRPGAEERDFTLTDYIAGRLESALDAVLGLDTARPLVLGYCMGGTLAVALAQRRQADLTGLALLATPWDFHADAEAKGALGGLAATALSPVIEALGELPVDAIQVLFAGLDPQLVPRKFAAFARLDPASRAAAVFVALEDWLNDGVPLAGPVARECLSGWYGRNTPAGGQWRVAGRPVDPGRLDLPCLCVIPAHDRIVPPASAEALAAAIPGAERLTPAAGHIGMVVGRQARAQVWRPLAAWLAAHAGGSS